jgi:hypothetical protein
MRRMTRLAVVLALAALLGCGGGSRPTADVKGEVTYEGKQVENGTITFTPLEGGPTVGGVIVDGKYVANNVTSGKNKVDISSAGDNANRPGKGQEAGAAYAERMRVYEVMKTGSRTDAIRAANSGGGTGGRAGAIPPNAVGNKQTIDVTPGKLNLNFDLFKPSHR